jgi:peptidyl-prolyl cis-trans isomerase C
VRTGRLSNEESTVTAIRVLSFVAATLLGVATIASASLGQDSRIVATINGKAITEGELNLANAEIGAELGNVPEETKRRVLIEFMIESQLLADAADSAKLGQGADFEQRTRYWRRRALRDTYFENKIKGAVTDAEARTFYDGQVAQMKPEEEIKTRHILVESEDVAKQIREKIAHGANFAQMAKEHSKDPGSKDDGGELGYFGRGQMVPQFEEAAFKLQKGDLSEPVQTQFGWHLIQLDDRRQRKPPEFGDVKERLMAAMVHRKAQEIVAELRGKAKIEYVDPAIKAQVEAEKQATTPPKK